MHIHRHICVYARVHTCYTWELKKRGLAGRRPAPRLRSPGQNRPEHYGPLWATMAVMRSILEVSQKVSRMGPAVKI